MTSDSQIPASSYSTDFNKKLRYGAAGVIAVAVIAIGLYFYLDHKYRTIVADFNQSLQPTGTFAYSGMDVSPFLGKVTLHEAVITYKNSQLIKANKVELRGLDGSAHQLTHARINAENLQFSPTGRSLADMPTGTSSAFVVTGNLKAEYSYDPSSNSYHAKSFAFDSVDQKMALHFDDAKLDNLKFASDQSVQSFAFAIDNAEISNFDRSLTAATGTDQKTITQFSSTLGYEKLADGTTQFKNFSLKLPQTNDYAAFELASWHADNDKLPLVFATEIKGLDVPAKLYTPMADFWKSYGYERVKSDGKFSYAFDKETKKINGLLALDLTSMFKTQISATLTGLDLEALAQDPNASVISYDALQIETAEVNFTDASFLKKTLENEAKKQNITVAEYTAQLGTDIDKAFLSDPTNAADPALVDTAGKLKAYINTLGTLTISMRPAQPVPFSQVMIGLILDRVKLLKAMGVTVTVS